MADVYKFLESTTARVDCDMLSSITGSILIGESLEVSEVAAGWYKTIKGWVWGFKGKNPILAKVETTDTDIKVGAYVKFNPTDKVYDAGGSLIPFSNNSENSFSIADIAKDNSLVLLTNGTSNYWVDPSVLKVSSNGVIVVPPTVAQQVYKPVEDKLEEYNTTDSYLKKMAEQFSGNQNTDSNWLNPMRLKDTKAIFGMPYQYMEIADPRITSDADSFGITYAEKIVSKLPLLIMVPGTPQFLQGYSKKEKEDLLSWSLSNLGESGTKGSDFNDLLNNPGKYYGLKQDWTSYFMHVNPMCRAAARMLGLQDYSYYGQSLGDCSWEKIANESIADKLQYKGGVAFYINAENQISESFSNSSSQSMLASKINGISDLGREMNFLLGGASAATGLAVDHFTQDKMIAKNEENSKDMVDKMLGANTLIEGVTSGLKTVIAGGKLIFPEIWSDSQFSRDYDISIKLVSPDPDILSLYLNIIVPILHLVGFVAPRSVGNTGYVSPFLVRAFYKGMFNCDMGIITNMSIQKGAEGAWSPFGIPTVVEVHFTIKELYGTMAITSNKNISQGLLRNTSLMDYIGNLCGININEADVQRTLYFYYSQFFRDKWKDKVNLGVVGALDQWATNAILNFSAKF